MKRNFLALLTLFCCTSIVSFATQPVVRFERSDFTASDSAKLAATYGRNKELIPEFALQTLIALSYFPELKDTYIKFVYQPARATLTTKPLFPSLLLKGNKRRFIIIVSDSTMWKLEPALLSRMDFNAQVGIIGHELSHCADFYARSELSLIGSGIQHISSKYIDRFEYRTDSICIAHGLGYQLLSWSVFIRQCMQTENWDGADNIDKPVMTTERYMNPATIRKRISEDPQYVAALQRSI